MIKECKSQVCCRIDSCSKRHHTLLHHVVTIPPMAHAITRTTIIQVTVITQKHPNQILRSYTFLQVIPIILSNGPLSVEMNALLDCGSDTTLLRKDIAKR